ncbi:serine hydrolase domain-containing protein [Microbacterium sp. LWS13-1.2]|uniref:Beta-lactamase family protein n=1 Tax=Microbacterium sp. LWS13-1.2 TaxID=3135264 RepID=A0AAU6SET2_9MICO
MTLPTQQHATVAAQDRPELQAILDDIVDSGITGITLRLRDEHGEWTGAAGRSEIDGDAKPPIDGHVRIGSNTKTFTAALTLRLVAEGRIALNTPASEYLPEFDLDPRITVRMLLQHTSGEAHTTDVTEHNPSWISSGGDMISTSQDLQRFISSIASGTLLPAELHAEMCATRETPIPGMGYGPGVFVQDLGAHGRVITHNGGAAGFAALMYATPDGRRTMTATLNYVDDAAMSLAVPFQQGSQRLVDAVFRTGRAATPAA